MFESRAVVNVNPSNSCKTTMSLGSGNGFLTSRLFTSLKSGRKQTLPFFFGCINEGTAHSDAGCHSNTSILQSLLISALTVALCLCGIGKALPW